MAATPRYGTAMFRGEQTGRAYAVDIYISDVAGASVNWDGGNGAGASSPSYWKAPENVVLYDLSLASGLADTTNIALTADGAVLVGSRLRYANFLNTLAFRPTQSRKFPTGALIGAIQYA